jgi:2-methylcitrate dehydratase PrpD
VTLDRSLIDVLHWLWGCRPTEDAAIEARSRELLLDTIGCAIAGTVEPEVAALFRWVAAADPGTIRFPGVPDGVSLAGFCSAFAAAACWHEACEGLAAAHGRPGLHAIPAVLGTGLARATPLGVMLDAIVAGYEIGGRLGMVCRIRPGMHVDGTWGSFAAAASISYLAQSSASTALSALNHVACHMPFSLYLPIATGSTARNAYAGHGATHGAAAAVASMAGLGGPPGSIAEMARLALGIDEDDLLMPPGPGVWLLPDGYLKPYPAVRHVHYGVAAAQGWHAETRARPDAITAIRLRIYPEAITYCGNRSPATAIQAQFSLSYGVARALATGRLDPAAYTSQALLDPLGRRLEALVELQADPAAGDRRGCTLEVNAGDNDVWTTAVHRVPGDPGMPMTRQQVREKFLGYAGPVIGIEHASAIATRLLEGAITTPFRLGRDG